MRMRNFFHSYSLNFIQLWNKCNLPGQRFIENVGKGCYKYCETGQIKFYFLKKILVVILLYHTCSSPSVIFSLLIRKSVHVVLHFVFSSSKIEMKKIEILNVLTVAQFFKENECFPRYVASVARGRSLSPPSPWIRGLSLFPVGCGCIRSDELD